MTDLLSELQCAFCPTCQRYPSQMRGTVRGTRHCFSCGEVFTLKESRKAEAEWKASPEGQAVVERARELRRQIWKSS